MSPNICSENIIMIIPAPILSWYELSRISEPKNVAVAPKLMNTIENPTANKIIGKIFTVFFQVIH